MQQYTTFFEITQKGFSWWFPAAGLVIAAVGLFVIRKNQPRTKWAYALVAGALLWTMFTFSFMQSEYSEFRQAYRTGQFQVVEGPVERFDPMPWEGHKEECFSVQHVRFCYSDFVITSGFNETSSHGGPIRDGLPVRVSYIGNTILKLEIKSDSAPSPTETRRRRLESIGADLILLGFLPAVALVCNAAFWLYDMWRKRIHAIPSR